MMTSGKPVWGEYIPGVMTMVLENSNVIDELSADLIRLKYNRIILCWDGWRDLSFLNPFKHKFSQCWIKVTDPEVFDWETVSTFSNLVQLEIEGWYKADLSFEKLDNLIWLNTYWNRGYDEESLFRLPNLQYLKIIGWKDVDCKRLSTLKKLRHLELVNCRKLTNLDGLESLPLKSVLIHGALSLNNIEAIQKRTNLQHLHLESCKKIKDFSCIEKLKELVTLQIANCGETSDLAFLRALIRLQYIRFAGTAITDGDTTHFWHLPSLKDGGFQNKRNFNRKSKDLDRYLSEKWGAEQEQVAFNRPRIDLGLE